MQHLLGAKVGNGFLVVFIAHLVSVEMLSGAGQSWLVKWVHLYLRLHFLVVRKVIRRAKLSFLEVLKGQTMTEQNISLLALGMWQNKIFVLNFLQFFNLRLDNRMGSIRIYRFGRNSRFKLGRQMFILILILDNKLFFRFCNFSRQNVRNFFLDNFTRLGLSVSKFVGK